MCEEELFELEKAQHYFLQAPLENTLQMEDKDKEMSLSRLRGKKHSHLGEGTDKDLLASIEKLKAKIKISNAELEYERKDYGEVKKKLEEEVMELTKRCLAAESKLEEWMQARGKRQGKACCYEFLAKNEMALKLFLQVLLVKKWIIRSAFCFVALVLAALVVIINSESFTDWSALICWKEPYLKDGSMSCSFGQALPGSNGTFAVNQTYQHTSIPYISGVSRLFFHTLFSLRILLNALFRFITSSEDIL